MSDHDEDSWFAIAVRSIEAIFHWDGLGPLLNS